MAVRVNKPILVVGIGISFLLWLLDSLHHRFLAVGEWGLLLLMAMGTGLWWWQKKTNENPSFTPISPLTEEQVNQAIAQSQTMLAFVAKEDPQQDISELQTTLKDLPKKFACQALTIGLVGGTKTGKTTLKNLLSIHNIDDQVSWVEKDYLENDVDNDKTTLDLAIFLTASDLSESQWQSLQDLNQTHQRCLIVLNKQDQYHPEEKSLVLQQIKERVKLIIPAQDVIAINAVPTSLKIRQYQNDGSMEEWTEDSPPQIDLLITRLTEILQQERQALIWGKVWREAISIEQQGKKILNKIRRDRALPVIKQYQWIAAATAFANPVSALDLLATAAINGQMVVDLSGIYQQQFTLSQGKAASVAIGKLMVQLGLVELSTHAISGLLKSNALTYVAGGVTQGVSAAYLTQVAGLSLIEYFQEQDISVNSKEKINLEQLTVNIKQVFERTRKAEILQDFVKQAIPRLS